MLFNRGNKNNGEINQDENKGEQKNSNSENLLSIDRRSLFKRTGQSLAALMAAGMFNFDFSTSQAEAAEGDISEKLIILHTNDMHGRIEEDRENDVMGMAYLKTIIDDFRENYDNVMLLDAGDTFHGTSVANTLDGRPVMETMNLIDYDVMTAGNHDFNFGYERMLELMDELTAETVSANVVKDGDLLLPPYTIKEIAGQKIAILGLATPATTFTTHPDNIVGIEFPEILETTQRYVDEIRSQYDPDLLITLGHVGYGANNPDDKDFTTTNYMLQNHVDGIDIFVDGHSHTRIAEGDWHDGTLVVQAYEYLKKLGVVEVDFSGDEPTFQAHLISSDDAFNNYEPDSEMEELLSELRDEAADEFLL